MTFNDVLNWPIPVLITNLHRQLLFINQSCIKLYGATYEELVSQWPEVIKSGMTANAIYDELNETLLNKGAWSGVLINRHIKEKCFLIISLTIMKMQIEGQWVYVSLHQPLDRLSVQSAASLGLLQTIEGIFLMSMAKIAEWNDPELEKHVYRVSKFARWISEMASDNEIISVLDVDLIEAASVVHDIGKAAIAKEILFKPGGLTNGERILVNDHASIGGDMITTMFRQLEPYHHLYRRLFEYARDSALTHHEWWNGEGYPNGLKGQEIPMIGRIVALADVIDALLSDRPYKRAWKPAKVKEYILHKKGKQFDPELVDLVVGHWDKRPIFHQNYSDNEI